MTFPTDGAGAHRDESASTPRHEQHHHQQGDHEHVDVTMASQRRPVWETWEPGVRVMVRTRLPEGSSHLYTDLLGTITARTDGTLTLETRSGTVEVAVESIATGKVVPPAPARRRPRDT